jgi:transmembrane sensor
MPTFESSRSIDEAASDWTARLDRGPLSPAEEAGLEAWLRADPRSRGALLRAQAVSIMSESAQALGPQFDPADFADQTRASRSGISRRRTLLWTGSAVTGAALISLGVSMPAAGSTASTGRGELRLVPLKDGSTVMLNTDTSVRIQYSARERLITLVKGEAYFSVTRNEATPFVVEVSGRRLMTAQATFSVRSLDGAAVDLLVHQGLVEFAAPSWSDQPPIAVRSNMRVALAQSSFFLRAALSERPYRVAPDVTARELAWLEGKIAFEGDTLQAAADSFARYSNTRIVIRGADLAREPVAGLFAANDPVGFSRAIATVFDAKMVRVGDTIVLSRGAALQ